MCLSNGVSQELVLQVFISCKKEDAHFFILMVCKQMYLSVDVKEME